MNPTGKFHVSDNWFFERTEDGGVKISRFDDPSQDRPTNVLIMTADAWASVCTAVSATGFNPERPRKHDQYHDLHDS